MSLQNQKSNQKMKAFVKYKRNVNFHSNDTRHQVMTLVDCAADVDQRVIKHPMGTVQQKEKRATSAVVKTILPGDVSFGMARMLLVKRNLQHRMTTNQMTK